MAIYSRELTRTGEERKRAECLPMAPKLRDVLRLHLAWYEQTPLVLRVEYLRNAGEITGARLHGSLG